MRLRAFSKQKKSQTEPAPGWSDVLAPKVINQFIGSHIAIVHKKVVAAGDSYEAVVEEAERLFPDETPYYAFIPEDKSNLPPFLQLEDLR
jgi:hypothetical protein